MRINPYGDSLVQHGPLLYNPPKQLTYDRLHRPITTRSAPGNGVLNRTVIYIEVVSTDRCLVAQRDWKSRMYCNKAMYSGIN